MVTVYVKTESSDHLLMLPPLIKRCFCFLSGSVLRISEVNLAKTMGSNWNTIQCVHGLRRLQPDKAFHGLFLVGLWTPLLGYQSYTATGV